MVGHPLRGLSNVWHMYSMVILCGLFVPKDSIMDYNEMVFFHSLVCLIGASYLLYDTHKNLRLLFCITNT